MAANPAFRRAAGAPPSMAAPAPAPGQMNVPGPGRPPVGPAPPPPIVTGMPVDPLYSPQSAPSITPPGPALTPPGGFHMVPPMPMHPLTLSSPSLVSQSQPLNMGKPLPQITPAMVNENNIAVAPALQHSASTSAVPQVRTESEPLSPGLGSPVMVTPDFTSKYMPDPIGEYTLRTALSLQDTLAFVLRSLSVDFYQPLLESPVGPSCEAEIVAAFKDILAFTDNAQRLADSMRDMVKRKNFVTLASILNEEKSYMLQLAQFSTALCDGFYKIRAIRGSKPEVNNFLAECFCGRNQKYVLDDLLLYAANYPQQMLQLCKTQLVYRVAFERAHGAVLSAAQFCEPLCPDVFIVRPYVEYDVPTNECLKPLSDIVVKTSELASWIGGSAVVRQIRIPPWKVAPDSLVSMKHRKLIEIVPGRIRHEKEFGLSYTVSGSLIIFSDCLVLCRNDSSDNYRKYVFSEFYAKETLSFITDAEKKSITLYNCEPCLDDKLLPPGWEEVSNSRKKEHFFVYKPGGIKQEQNPMAVGTVKNRAIFIIDSTTNVIQTSLKLRELTGNQDSPEIKEPPHIMVGVDIKTLTDFERLWKADLQMPELFMVLLQQLLTYGSSEKGIFRVAAEKRILDELCARIQTDELSKIEWSNYSIHHLSGLMKMLLRDMPTPLLPFELYSEFMGIARMEPKDRVAPLTDLVLRLPKYNREMLRWLIKMMYQIHCNQHVNAMDCKNLGIVTAPNILRNKSRAEMTEMNAANTVIGTMIEEYETIFEESLLGREVREAALAAKEWVLFRRKLLGTDSSVCSMVADPDNHTVLAIDGHATCALFDSEKGTFIKSVSLSKKLPGRVPPSNAIYINGKFWISFMISVLVIDAKTLEVEQTLSVPARSITLASENEVWVGGEGQITIFSAADFSVIETLTIKKRSVVAMVSFNGQVWGACKQVKKNEIHQWDQKTHAHVSHFVTDLKDIFALAVHGKTVWTASDTPCISAWDTETKECLARVTAAPVTFSICVLPDQVWFGSKEKTLIVDPKTFKCVGELHGYQPNTVYTLLPVPRGDHTEVWSGCFDKSVCIWSVTALPKL